MRICEVIFELSSVKDNVGKAEKRTARNCNV